MKSLKSLPAKRTIASSTVNKHHQDQQRHRGEQKNPQSKHNNETARPSNSSPVTRNALQTTSGSSNTDPICNICAQNVPGPEREKVYAFGKCDHHVCYVCSARLRAICNQDECPICREKLDSVIFSANKDRSYDEHDLSNYIYDEKYKIYFESQAIKEAFDKLLEIICLKCPDRRKDDHESKEAVANEPRGRPYSDVLRLKNHLFFRHKLKLCDLCLEHNKLFPFEYSYYENHTLRKHMREGEANTSHRGHPDCDLCHLTFFNQDELLQHMSREHYHCHLCGRQNSTMHLYFQDYQSLRAHFKLQHYLCERANCRYEQFTHAFDSQIDYQLHIAQVHGGATAVGTRESRQQRTITLESAPHRMPPNRNQSIVPSNAAVVTTGTPATSNSSDPARQIPASLQAQIQQQRVLTVAEFPALGQRPPRASSTALSQSVAIPTTSTTNHFPSLPGNSANRNSSTISLQHRVTAGSSRDRPSFVRSAGGGNRPPERIDEAEFPPLPEQCKSKSKSASKTKLKQNKVIRPDESMTLDQLISSSLVLSTRNQNNSRPSKTGKTSKPKPIKIQL